MIGAIKNLVKKVFANVQIDIQVEIEASDTFSLEVDMALVYELSENEAVWSDFYAIAIPVGRLHYSHTDSNGVAGYRISGTNTLVWRDQLSPVAFVAAA